MCQIAGQSFLFTPECRGRQPVPSHKTSNSAADTVRKICCKVLNFRLTLNTIGLEYSNPQVLLSAEQNSSLGLSLFNSVPLCHPKYVKY
jgi:hypothetical protein